MSFSLRAEYFPLKVESNLKFGYQKYVRTAFVVAVIIHYIAIGTYWGIVSIQESRRTYVTRIVSYADLGPPPALTDAPPTPEVEVSTAVKPVIGIPDPVEDTEVSAEMTIATQMEMSQSVAPVIQVAEEKIVIQAPKEQKIVVEEEVLPKPDEFIAFEEPPNPISRPIPEYPDLAKKAGIEGMVMLKVLVDREGRIREVQLIRGLGAGLDESAIKSAWESKWTPAIQNHKPVAVWVSYPVRFKLR